MNTAQINKAILHLIHGLWKLCKTLDTSDDEDLGDGSGDCGSGDYEEGSGGCTWDTITDTSTDVGVAIIDTTWVRNSLILVRFYRNYKKYSADNWCWGTDRGHCYLLNNILLLYKEERSRLIWILVRTNSWNRLKWLRRPYQSWLSTRNHP